MGPDYVLVFCSLRKWSCRLGVSCCCVGLGEDRRLAEFEFAIRDSDLFLGLDSCLLRLTVVARFGDGRFHLGARGLRATEVLQVAALGLDVLQLERVEHESLVGERRLGLFGYLASECGSILHDLFHRESADDRAQRTGEHLLRERLNLVLLTEEPLRGRPNGIFGAANLHDRYPLEGALDALSGYRRTNRNRDLSR